MNIVLSTFRFGWLCFKENNFFVCDGAPVPWPCMPFAAWSGRFRLCGALLPPSQMNILRTWTILQLSINIIHNHHLPSQLRYTLWMRHDGMSEFDIADQLQLSLIGFRHSPLVLIACLLPLCFLFHYYFYISIADIA